MNKHLSYWAAGMLAAATATATWATDRDRDFMPPGQMIGTKAEAAEFFRLPTSAPALRISAPVVEGALDELKSQNSNSDRKILKLGYGRELNAADRVLDLNTLPWQTLADGSKAVQIQLEASEAAAVRVGYRVTGDANGIEIRFAGDKNSQVFMQTGEEVGQDFTIWSPVLEGSVATMELRLLPGRAPADYGLRFEQLSHMVTPGPVSGADLKHVSDIGQSGSCNENVVCEYSDVPLREAASSVAKILFVKSGGATYMCTAVSVNNAYDATITQLLTAAHCIGNAAEASSLESYWNFEATSCNSIHTPAAYQRVTGGATLQAADDTLDFSLVRTRQSAPAGTIKAGFLASELYPGTDVEGIHHPSGDLKKYSEGETLGYAPDFTRPGPVRDNFIYVEWDDGTTEGGSSGSPLFAFHQQTGKYLVRGVLNGGSASCANPNGYDRYSRLDLFYSMILPHLDPTRVPPATSGTLAVMQEYYNPEFDYYFMTSRENEKSLLDNLRDNQGNKLWYRTPIWFKARAQSASGLSSISRYYLPGNARGGARGSHFYTALNADRELITSSGNERFSTQGCGDVARGYFCNEGIDSYIKLPQNITPGQPDAARCQSNELPIYRAYRAAPRYPDDGAHRYTDQSRYNFMKNGLGWAGEGIVFCAEP